VDPTPKSRGLNGRVACGRVFGDTKPGRDGLRIEAPYLDRQHQGLVGLFFQRESGGSEIAIGEPIGEGIGKPLRFRMAATFRQPGLTSRPTAHGFSRCASVAQTT
jgi:hypothetical protein